MFTRRIYLDHAAAWPRTTASERAERRARRFFANPSSIHKDGVDARKSLEASRKAVADCLSAHSDEIIFASSGTESDNMAVLGVFKHARLNPAWSGRPVHVVTTTIEHPAVLEACKHIEAVGGEVTYLSVDEQGLVHPKDLRSALRPDTVLVSIAYANSEIGVVQPLREIRKEIAHFKKSQAGTVKESSYPLFHTDACQAAAYLNLTVEQLGVDLLTLNGAKLGAGHGASVLYVRRGTPIAPMMYGGGQEKNLHSGTENVVGAAGLATALVEAHALREGEVARLSELRDDFIVKVRTLFPDVRINGSLTDRLPNNVHLSFNNFQSELLVLELDAKGIAVSAGSACSGAKDTGSHVVTALYGSGDENEWGSIRLTFGPTTTKRDLAKVLEALDSICKKYSAWR